MAATPTTLRHDPQAVLDYSVNWSSWLAEAEVITASAWTVPAQSGDPLVGIVQTTPAPSHSDTAATIWLTGGVAGKHYRVTNHITTNQGRQDDRSITLSVVER